MGIFDIFRKTKSQMLFGEMPTTTLFVSKKNVLSNHVMSHVLFCVI